MQCQSRRGSTSRSRVFPRCARKICSSVPRAQIKGRHRVRSSGYQPTIANKQPTSSSASLLGLAAPSEQAGHQRATTAARQVARHVSSSPSRAASCCGVAGVSRKAYTSSCPFWPNRANRPQPGSIGTATSSTAAPATAPAAAPAPGRAGSLGSACAHAATQAGMSMHSSRSPTTDGARTRSCAGRALSAYTRASAVGARATSARQSDSAAPGASAAPAAESSSFSSTALLACAAKSASSTPIVSIESSKAVDWGEAVGLAANPP
mmetsp:Transcript_50203/g.115175  ORF Transcript_50203/g.115175 Transcript_50203/m.115175 type:complete len:265 (+) Transcript_50203:2603-3397(+)